MVIPQVWSALLESYYVKYHSGEWELKHIAGDGSWASRRNSKVGYYTITDTTTGKIICESILVKEVAHQRYGRKVVINKGNYIGTSKGMEAEAFHQCVAAMDNAGILAMVKTITTDDDSSVKKMVAEDSHLKHLKVQQSSFPSCDMCVLTF